MTNPNQKGTLGEIAVCKELIQLGYSVFVEFGNHSKVDLIALDKEFKTYKIQIKATKSKNEIVEVYSTKNCLNPKYNSTYTIHQVDVFAVYRAEGVVDAAGRATERHRGRSEQRGWRRIAELSGGADAGGGCGEEERVSDADSAAVF